MKCKLNMDLSELRAFANDEDHCYLRAVFVPTEIGLLQSLSLGNQAQFTLNIYPGRDADGNVNEKEMEAIQTSFHSGELEKQTYYVDRVAVEVEPFVMKRSRDSQYGKKGDIIMDGNNARVYKTIAITCFHKLVDGKEQPLLDENALKTRANTIKNFRIKNGDWIDLTKYIAESENPEEHEEEPTDDDYDEAQDKQNPINKPKPKKF